MLHKPIIQLSGSDRTPSKFRKAALVQVFTDRTLRIWDAGKCAQALKGHTNWIFRGLSPGWYSPPSVAHNHVIRVWNATIGECLHVCEGHQHLVSSLAFSAGGEAIASGSQDQTIRIWSARTGDYLGVLVAKRLYGERYELARCYWANTRNADDIANTRRGAVIASFSSMLALKPFKWRHFQSNLTFATQPRELQ